MFSWWKKVVFENYANFDGRARRKEYWFYSLFNLLVYLVGAVVIGIFAAVLDDEAGDTSIIGIVLFLLVVALLITFALVTFIPGIAVLVRRLHDTGRSGWFYFISLVPFGGLIVLFFLASDSTPGLNQYGDSPKYPSQGEYGSQPPSGMPNQPPQVNPS